MPGTLVLPPAGSFDMTQTRGQEWLCLTRGKGMPSPALYTGGIGSRSLRGRKESLAFFNKTRSSGIVAASAARLKQARTGRHDGIHIGENFYRSARVLSFVFIPTRLVAKA